jgi:apolipoprotein N-acyltransferase
MQETLTTSLTARRRAAALIDRARVEIPDLTTIVLALLSSVLLILSFPDFNLWPVAFIGLVPLLFIVANRPAPAQALLLGWLSGAVFFYGSCHWLTFSMINYGGLPGWLAYLLLIPGALAVGLFPGLFSLVLALGIRVWRTKALLLAPFIWVAFEWARLGVTGQLWNALGYSLAYQTQLIKPASWGGVYAVSFLIVAVNAAIAYVLISRTGKAIGMSIAVLAFLLVPFVFIKPITPGSDGGVDARVVALQPNVPMHLVKSVQEMRELTTRHITMTENALRDLPRDGVPTIVIWPESPMNFTYGSDSTFRELITSFARRHQVSVLFNSQELAPNDGIYNSAMLINDQGQLVGQYDKIRLLPFGEYVPLPRWVPGASLISGIVGDFMPGTNFTLFQAGTAPAGVFICIESAYPSIARTFANEGAEVLINISNDGYLGRTAVVRQHLANAVFRAVENGRPVLRVTNTGITAYIDAKGELKDPTPVFEPAVRVWTLCCTTADKTFYTRNGDLFALFSMFIMGLVVFAYVVKRRLRAATDQDLEKA